METILPSPSTSSTVVNGLSSPVKRKSEAQEKPKKKAKTTNSQDEGATTTAESDNEEQSPPKTPTPKAPKTPGKTPQAEKTLPEGFRYEIKQRGQEGGKKEGTWKEYYGPDGKKYRSVAEIYKKLNIDPESGPGESSSSQEKMSTQEMKEHVEEVVSTWNRGEEGDMAKNKNKFYNSVGLKKLPKTERHFTEVKSKKKGKASQEPVEEDKDVAEEASSSTPLDVRSENQANVTISDTGDIKKKKKKKKNKENDKTV